MLSNRAPNLEAKMEKGISNNQKGGGGSTLAMAQVCSEKPPSGINWTFLLLTHTAPLLSLLGTRGGGSSKGMFRRWLVVRGEKADSLLEQEGRHSHLCLLQQ